MMGELIEEYGRIILFVLIGVFVLSVIAFSWEAIGNYMIRFYDAIA
jgi:hypothetical protein